MSITSPLCQTQHGNGHVTIDLEALDAVYFSFSDDPTMTATLLSASSHTVEHLGAEAIEDPSGSTAVTSALILLENPLLEETEHHWCVCLGGGCCCVVVCCFGGRVVVQRMQRGG